MELKKYKLGELCKLSSAKRIFEDEYVHDGVPFIRGQEVSDKSILDENAKFDCYISQERYNEIRRDYGVPQKGDILMTAVGTIGNLIVLNIDRQFYFKDGNIIRFSDFVETVCSDWLAFYMQSSFFKKQLENQLIGAVQKALTMVMLNKTEILLPPIEYQQKIASILSALDRKIALNRAINRNLEALAKQLYDYWFVQFDFPDEKGRPYKSSGGKMMWNEVLKREVPEGWTPACVKDVINPIERGISYSSEEIASPEGYPMLNLACYSKKGDYRVGEMKFFTGNIKESDKVYPYDMLIACTDMTQGADVIGRPILASEEFGWFLYSMDLAKIKPANIKKYYLYYTLRTPFYHKYIKPFASGTNVKHLNILGVENYVIPIPPISLQSKFEVFVSEIKKQQMLIINENKYLTKQRDELLPLLMNGQVTIEN